jgi:hypothetical protein
MYQDAAPSREPTSLCKQFSSQRDRTTPSRTARKRTERGQIAAALSDQLALRRYSQSGDSIVANGRRGAFSVTRQRSHPAARNARPVCVAHRRCVHAVKLRLVRYIRASANRGEKRMNEATKLAAARALAHLLAAAALLTIASVVFYVR